MNNVRNRRVSMFSFTNFMSSALSFVASSKIGLVFQEDDKFCANAPTEGFNFALRLSRDQADRW